MKSRFIVFDGLDASGKKTQSELLAEHLKKSGEGFRYLDFPTYHPDYSHLVSFYLKGGFGSDPESVNAYAASSFFAMDRYCSYILDWKKDYDCGKILLANRYTPANAVHQLSKLPESEYDGFLDWLVDFEHKKLGLPVPDKVIYLALPPEMSLRLLEKRCAETGAAKDIHESNRAHIENSYKAAVYSAKKLGWHTVNVNDGGEYRPVAEIHKEIVKLAEL